MWFVCFQVDQQQNTDNRVSQMFDLTFRNTSGDDEKRKQVCNLPVRFLLFDLWSRELYAL